ncbi:MAG: class I SAM-dependent methyltransferase [Candidatus Binataceae bacterium]
MSAIAHRHQPSPFAGTAHYYARCRPPYPAALLDRIARALRLDGRGMMLDLGCGTGQLAIPMARRFQHVVAVDPEVEMLIEGRAAAERAGATNVTWLEGNSTALPAGRGPFRLVTIGRALHWMDRERVLADLHQLVTDDGGIAVVNDDAPIIRGTQEWKLRVVEVIQRYLGSARRAGEGTFEDPAERHDVILARSQFLRMTKLAESYLHEWAVDSILGVLYSTSFCSRRLLGDRADAFEADVTSALLSIEASGRFRETIEFEALLAWKC